MIIDKQIENAQNIIDTIKAYDENKVDFFAPSIQGRDDADARIDQLKKSLINLAVRIHHGGQTLHSAVMNNLIKTKESDTDISEETAKKNAAITGALYDLSSSINRVAEDIKKGDLTAHDISLLQSSVNAEYNPAVVSSTLPPSEKTLHAENVARNAHKLAQALGDAMPPRFQPRTELLNQQHPLAKIVKEHPSEKEAAAMQLAGVQFATAFAEPAAEIMKVMQGDAPHEKGNADTIVRAIMKAPTITLPQTGKTSSYRVAG